MSQWAYIIAVLLLAPVIVLVSAMAGGWLYHCGKLFRSPIPSPFKSKPIIESNHDEPKRPPLRLTS